MRPYLLYLKYVIRHKFFVFVESCRLGVPWLGLTHDLSKFRPSEFIPYARHFYGNGGNIRRGRDKTGYFRPGDTGDQPFDAAWLWHQHRSPHHWQFWCLTQDDDPPRIIKMPDHYMREMLADWRGAGLAQGTPDTAAWYQAHRKQILLHPETRAWIEQQLGIAREAEGQHARNTA